ncbi:MAG: glucose/galactose MFS transporter [Bacteroidetes bacterium]|nr:glucose/galactose MFS transporter [Bacteroidota bacterium]
MAKHAYRTQIVLVGAFFFIFGFITWVNGTLIPYLRIACELKEWMAYLVTFAFYISYTAMAIPSSAVLAKTGMVKGMRLGLIIMSAGCILFVPAALTRSYPLFLLGLFVIGTGTTLLQTAVNPYITLLGPPDKAAQRMSIMGICNKSAGVVAPLVLGAIILRNSGGLLQELQTLAPPARSLRLDELARDVIIPYLILAAILLLIAAAIRYAHLPEVATSPATTTPLAAATSLPAATASPSPTTTTYTATTTTTPSPATTYTRTFFLGFLATFSCVGLEVIAGDTIGNYGLYHGIPLSIAKHLTSYTLAFTVAGYLFGVLAIPRLISQERAFLLSSATGILISLAVLFTPGKNSVYCVAALGLSNALLWPAIWPQALKGLSGKALSQGSAILIMGIAGGAIMPLLYSWLAKSTNNQSAYCLLIPCYLFTLYYYFLGKRQSQI